MVVVAVVVGLVAAGVAVWWFGFRAEDEFVLGTDSLCEWFTAEEMTDIVRLAQVAAGTQFEFDAFEPGDCQGEPGPSEAQRWTTNEGWMGGEDGDVGLFLGPATGDGRGGDWKQMEPDEFGPHEMLGDAVSYGNLSYFFGWGPGIEVQLRVAGHDDEVLVFGWGVEDAGDWFLPGPGEEAPSDLHTEYQSLGFAVARLMLEDMGWID
jgi:hypothetical protein